MFAAILFKIVKIFKQHECLLIGNWLNKNDEITMQQLKGWGFPGGAVVKNLPANAGDTGSSPGLGRSHKPRSN